MEYFNLGVNPIFRENYVFGKAVTAREKGYKITESCIGCGTYTEHCLQRCIEVGTPCPIQAEHCLHCGARFENCPVWAVIKL